MEDLKGSSMRTLLSRVLNFIGRKGGTGERVGKLIAPPLSFLLGIDDRGGTMDISRSSPECHTILTCGQPGFELKLSISDRRLRQVGAFPITFMKSICHGFEEMMPKNEP